MVVKTFSRNKKKYQVNTISSRWGEKEFNKELKNTDSEYIINCIGAIPQKYSEDATKYKSLNIDLPEFLEKLNKRIIHPSTDCEFSGKIEKLKKYNKTDKRDAEDEYGKSKAFISKKIESKFKNTKIIRTSIIGRELKNHLSLLDWTLTGSEPINGYVDHYWNGITTLQWCKICQRLIDNWEMSPKINQFGTEKIISKYELIKTIIKIYNKKRKVIKYNTGKEINKCLESDFILPSIEKQIAELKDF